MAYGTTRSTSFEEIRVFSRQSRRTVSKRTTKFGIKFKSVDYEAMPSSSVSKTYRKDEVSYLVSFLGSKGRLTRFMRRWFKKIVDMLLRCEVCDYFREDRSFELRVRSWSFSLHGCILSADGVNSHSRSNYGSSRTRKLYIRARSMYWR